MKGASRLRIGLTGVALGAGLLLGPALLGLSLESSVLAPSDWPASVFADVGVAYLAGGLALVLASIGLGLLLCVLTEIVWW